MDDYDPDSLTLDKAVSLVLDLVEPIPETEELELFEASNRILARPVVSSIQVPAGRNSAMDGYALKHTDLNNTGPTRLTVIGKSLAGHPWTGVLQTGQTVRITTGALLPDAADCVVMQEQVEIDGERITIRTPQKPGQHVREAGSDIQQSQTVLETGSRLGPAELGLLASVGNDKAVVCRRPRVAIFSTGDELVAPGETPRHGQIYDSNRYILHGLLDRAGAEIIDLGIVADSKTALEETFAKAQSADVIISTGGVSVGEADFVRDVLADLGQLHLWKIAMKPGRPLTVGKLNRGGLFFGLPGNPVSGIVTFHLFVAAALNKMQGLPRQQALSLPACCTDTLRKLPGRIEFQRGIMRKNTAGQWEVSTTGLQDSHVLTSVHKANCFIILEMDSSGAEKGDMVNVIPFSGLS